jgi:DNA-directed RNA polymerase subunit RPC12/RpoP/uncharacterized caspase-like protein
MKKYALVVGISKYGDPEITDLSFAARDAQEVGQCLRDVCGFDVVRVLVTGGDKEPDHVNIVDALHNLAPLLSYDDLFLFYFAGHGIQTKAGAHLLTANSRIHIPQLASLSMAVLGDCLGYMESAHRVLILDACRNDPRKGMGDADNLLTPQFSRDIITVAQTPVEGQVPATCVLFSCSEGERAYEWPDQKHGAFTHYLLEGIRGEAMDREGRLTIQGLGRYVQQQVPRWAKRFRTPRPQTPWGEQIGSWREILLAGEVSEVQEAVSRADTLLCSSRFDAEHPTDESAEVVCPYEDCAQPFDICEGDGEYTCPHCGRDVIVGDETEEDPEEIFDVECPHCGDTFQVSEGDGEYTCPYCWNDVIVGDETEEGLEESFDVECPHCGDTFQVSEGDGEYTCPYCWNDVIVGDETEEDSEETFDVECPYCGDTFQVSEGDGEYTCPYCWNDVIVGDEEEEG